MPELIDVLPSPVRERMPGLTPGRIVHYVMPDRTLAGEIRPAIVVKVKDAEVGLVSLCVFLSECDYAAVRSGCDCADAPDLPVVARESVFYDDSAQPRPNTWHWIPRA
jgi:hypothetical protein